MNLAPNFPNDHAMHLLMQLLHEELGLPERKTISLITSINFDLGCDDADARGGNDGMGAYLSVMQVLGLEQDLNKVGESDEIGRRLQDAQLSRTPSPKAENPMREQSTITSKVSKPSGSQTGSVIRESGYSGIDLGDVPLNTDAFSALFTKNKKPEPST
ncbi:hypothetical protein MO767_27515 [Pseudomonas sp. UYIF39]|uniref:hypothetical protein n=1 Tax=Pseudomonas sp. UYIF39 TaxID=1630747 RepID=UPI00249E2FD6|nr:hypothetical protein [Pseudomonas sp. UYIF39]MDI3358063.1 hypothetical protein [Pseudomonas sp. UYIF39]